MIDWKCLAEACSEAFWYTMVSLGCIVLGLIALIIGVGPLFLVIYTGNLWYLLFYILGAFVFFIIIIYKINLEERKVWNGKTPSHED